jgi:hypothetical protein
LQSALAARLAVAVGRESPLEQATALAWVAALASPWAEAALWVVAWESVAGLASAVASQSRWAAVWA